MRFKILKLEVVKKSLILLVGCDDDDVGLDFF